MKSRRDGCPSPIELERAFWSEDAAARAHTEACATCGAAWREIDELARAAREIQPAPSSAERREEIRTTLLAKDRRAASEPVSVAPWRWAAAFASAAAIAVALGAWWMWPEANAPESRARVLAHEGARFLVAANQPDEIVRLVDGTITVEVAPLRAGERFRVITGDAEVEVVGTAFDVTASGDRLAAVRVVHGVVEVRAAGAKAARLTAGESWRVPLAAAAASEPAAAASEPAPTPAVALSIEPAAPLPSVAGTRSAPPESLPPARERVREASDPVRPASDPVRPASDPVRPAPDAAPPAPPARAAAEQAFDDGWAALRAGAFDDAAAAFQRAAALDVEGRVSEDALYWRAVALARGAHAARAIHAFESFLDLHADSTHAGEANVMLGWLLYDRGERVEAERRFRAAARDRSERVRARAREGLDALR